MLRSFIVVALLASLPQSNPASSVQSSQAKELVFAWPIGISARVESERSTERRGDPQVNPPWTVVSSYRMQVLQDEQGYLVRRDDYKFSNIPKGITELTNALMSLSPSVIVDKDGAFTRVGDLEPLRDALRKVVASVPVQAMPPATRDLTAQLQTDAFQSGIAQTLWFDLVGRWIGFPPTGAQFEQQGEQAMAIAPHITLPVRMEMGMISRTVCSRAGRQYECGVFQSTTRADTKPATPLIEKLTGAVTGMPGAKLERYEQQTTVQVTMETATMLPHQFSSVQTMELTRTSTEAPRTQITQLNRQTLRFHYDSR